MTRLLVPIDSDINGYGKFELYVNLDSLEAGDVVYQDENGDWMNGRFESLPPAIQYDLREMISTKKSQAKPEEVEKVFERFGNLLKHKYVDPPRDLKRYKDRLRLLGELRKEDSELWGFFKVRSVETFLNYLSNVLGKIYETD